jgi:WD40 repeat protein
MHSISSIFPTLHSNETWLVFYLSDGNILATAAGQLRTFDTSDNKKIQKFSGHPVSMSFLFLPADVPLVRLVFMVICCI